MTLKIKKCVHVCVGQTKATSLNIGWVHYCLKYCSKGFQHTQGISQFSEFVYRKIGNRNKQSQKSGYQLAKLSQGFPCMFV